VTTPTKLNSRPCRRLTNREIVHVLGGVIGPLLARYGSGGTRQLLCLAREGIIGEIKSCSQQEHLDGLILFCLAGSLTNWCGTPNVVRALEWWIEGDHIEKLGMGLGTMLMEFSRIRSGKNPGLS
jgi:hypothetical protein